MCDSLHSQKLTFLAFKMTVKLILRYQDFKVSLEIMRCLKFLQCIVWFMNYVGILLVSMMEMLKSFSF